MFKALARAAGRLLAGAAAALGLAPKEKTAEELLSARDRARQLAMPKDFDIKFKLGRSYFTRGLSARTRLKRIRSLTHAERLRAIELGWIDSRYAGNFR